MPSESKSLLTVKREEKPNHYSYLKEFRVEQCSLFLQHKCTQHRPFTCFHWHFNNQRRRRPIRKRDGTFNYSADNYCTKYDETTGNCPDGDDCPFLHRTNGDTERRYHLRYYKTAMCVHDTDARGYCVKNGPHCAFAHGSDDLRPPVYDVKEMQASENASGENGANNGPNALDKERNLMTEDPKWQDTTYVLTCYKTVPCQRPPRLCRQGYACPAFHNSRDKRRNPRKYIYRSTPCPAVKHGDEWGEPGNCESGDSCNYCHTRTEQQFHPEIYKSTKCNDVQSAGYCPRGVFCAFAHLDQEMSIARDMDIGTVNLADILSSAMPPSTREENGESNDMREDLLSTLDNELSQFNSETNKTSLFMAPSPPQNHNSTILSNMQFSGLDHDTLDSVMGGAFDDLNMDEPVGLAAMDRDYDADSPTISNPISAGLASSGGLLGGSAPVAIPGSDNMGRGVLGSYSPSTASPLHHLQSGYLSSIFSHPEPSIDSGSLLNQLGGSVGSSKFGSSLTNGIMSPGRAHHPIANSPLLNSFPVSPSIATNSLMVEQMVRLREAAESRFKCEDQINHVRESCDMCRIQQRELEEANRKANIAEKRRDEAINQAKALQKEVDLLQGGPYLHGIRRVSELKTLPLTTLKSIQAQLKTDLEQVDKIVMEGRMTKFQSFYSQELLMQTGQKCMVCEERNRSVTLGPCNHYVLCAACAPEQKDCPYCKTPIVAHSNPSNSSVLHA